MFDRVSQEQRRRATREQMLPPPSRGWIQSGNLLQAPPDGAEVLDNFFPTAEGARLRGGTVKNADLGAPVRRLFTYSDSNGDTLFGSTDEGIYNVSRLAADNSNPNSPIYLVDEAGNCIIDEAGNHIVTGFVETYQELAGYTGTDSGDWSTTILSTAGGIFMVGVNGVNPAWYYDGAEFNPIVAQAINDLAFDLVNVMPEVGETVTGASSGATAVIYGIEFTAIGVGVLRVGTITGTFTDNETLTTPSGGNLRANIPSGTSAGSTVTITNVTTSSLIQVWNFKERLFFIEKDSLSAWYLPVESIGGAASELDLGSIFSRGGKLLFGATWSLDSGSGLDDVCIFVTSRGEIAVYEGTNPGDAAAWRLVGVYLIGTPLNKHAYFKAGGDLAILTKDGIVPVSEALKKDRAALQAVAITYPIEDAWKRAVANATVEFPITPTLWQAQTLLIMGVPDPDGQQDIAFVANSRTGAWCRFTGWDVRCSAVANDNLYIGSANGLVLQADVGGQDNVNRFTPDCGQFEPEAYGVAYTAVWVPKFSNFGSTSLKFPNHAGITYLASQKQTFSVKGLKDYQIPALQPPEPTSAPSGATWGNGVWGTFVWGSEVANTAYSQWRAIAAGGYTVSAALQITSNQGTIVPFEIVSMQMRYEEGVSF